MKHNKFDGFYFLAFHCGDRSRITVVDLMNCVGYERNEWENVNENTYNHRDEAIKAAREIAKEHGLMYVPFRSRYWNDDEKVFLY